MLAALHSPLLTVLLLIPVLGLGGLSIGDGGGDVVMSGGLDVLGVRDLGALVPLLGLGGLRVLDLLGGEDVEVLVQGAGGNLLEINVDLRGRRKRGGESGKHGQGAAMGKVAAIGQVAESKDERRGE